MESNPKDCQEEKESAVDLPAHIIIRIRRLELNLTQQQVADKANILLRQYQRFELGERNITSASAKLMLSICMALKIDPYMFFPDIKEDQFSLVNLFQALNPIMNDGYSSGYKCGLGDNKKAVGILIRIQDIRLIQIYCNNVSTKVV